MGASKLKEEVRHIFDNQFNQKLATKEVEELDNETIGLLQKLFVEHLHFEPVTGTFGGRGEKIDIENWSKRAEAEKAFIVAESQDFRVLYIRLDKLTRTAERHAVSSLKAKNWAREGEYLAVFHSSDSDVWHLVSPYMSEGRTILRRYVVGRGETHRTVSENLAKMDATRPEPLFDCVQEAFRLKPVTEKFYGDYKEFFGRLKEHIVSEGVEVSDAKKYAHLLLNRLMFLYFIQKKGWLHENKNFVRWYLEEYKKTDEENAFHRRWLDTLFFKAMSNPSRGKNIGVGLPERVAEVLNEFPFLNGGLFQKKDVDKLRIELPDYLLRQVIEGFLEKYNFTVTEESPFDRDIAVDPAMLGKIYESLIAEEERGKAGIFYTPRIEVDLMCRLAIYEYLTTPREKDETLDSSLLEELQEKNEDEIIEFLFTPPESWNHDDEKSKRLILLRDVLRSVKSVDPACGSGAFLVGMLHVLMELYKKLGVEPSYELKERVINENLYGVDIKDWAVRVAEFRLWLALIESEEDLPDVEPVLPNFSLKLRVGDSIVQKVGDEFVGLEELRKTSDPEVKEKLSELEKLKDRHFKGETDLVDEIRNKQLDILHTYLDKRIESLEGKKDENRQTSLEGKVTQEAKKEIAKIDSEVEEIKDTKRKLNAAGRKGIFLWDLSFPEVMLNGGFDIVIANPPYVKREKIIRQDYGPEELEDFADSKIRELKKKYKADLIEYISNQYQMRVGKRSDLYLYFFFKGFELLNPRGSLVFISSNSWLDVDYGKYLQEGILKNSKLDYVIDNRAKRSFEESDINTIISVARKKVEKTLSGETKFIAFEEPFEDTIDPKTMEKALLPNVGNFGEIKIKGEEIEVAPTDSFRLVKVPHRTLWKLGGGGVRGPQTKLNPTEKQEDVFSPFGNYSGAKWGKYIRAPDIYFEIIERSFDEFSKLKDYKIDSYLNTGGADKFFFVELVNDTNEDKSVIRNLEHDKEFIVESKFLKPLLKSPRGLETPKVAEEDTGNLKILVVPEDTEIENYEVEKYIHFGEEEGYNKRSGRKNKKPWWKPPKRANYGCEILLRRSYGENHTIYYNPNKIISNRFYRICNDSALTLNMILNSTLTGLFFEVLGNVNLGQGALELYKPDYKNIPVIKENEFIGNVNLGDVSGLLDRKVDSVFEEIGADDPEEVSLNKVKKDRRRLDKVIMEDILGLSKKEQLEVYRGVVRLVKNRTEKAQSV